MDQGERSLTALGHYQVAELLGAGGMGEVYLAHSPSGRAVAVKVIREDLAARPGFRERFAREVQAARQVSGAFTAPVLDADTTSDVPWMATQYVAGPSLDNAVKERGPLPAEEVWQLASGLCEALRDIHRVGLVHRDFKPANILLAEDGPRVIDFGISRIVDATALTQSGEMMGTPLFMAPEQFRDPREAGSSADVFALGSVLVYAATGHGPFDADTPYAIAWNAVHEEPNLSGLPESLRPVVEPCLHKEPSARPDLEALLALLSSRRERRTQPALARGAALALTRRKRLRRGASALSALVCAALVVGVWQWWPQSEGGEADAARPSATAPRATPTPVHLPGWKPWTTRLGDGLPDVSPTCRYRSAALWCTEGTTLAARLDPRTGKAIWRRTLNNHAAPTLLGVTQEAVVVGENNEGARTDAYRIWTFDAQTGKPLREQVIAGAERCVVAEETLFCTQGGAITAREPVGMERMWTGASGWDLLSPGTGESFDHVYVVKPDASGRPTEVGEITQGDGTLLWHCDVPQGADLVTVSGNFVYATGSSSSGAEVSRLMRIDRKTGAVKSLKLEVPEELLGVAGQVFYAHSGTGVVSAYDISAKRRLWSSTTLRDGLSAPSVDGDRVQFLSKDGTVIALDRRTGGVLWQSQPSIGTVRATEFIGPIPRLVTLGDVIIAPAPDLLLRSFLAPAASTASPTGGAIESDR
ncbi:protein kinase [Streptomyces sp. NPDC047043]|uniref:protein kinase domain-containing protein n=1 Tax=Streptomyces sp. NPDC047043 TaxID=3154497 RepID=UPI0033F10740